MRFLVDECAGPTLARWLRQQGHDAASIYEDSRGMRDVDVLDRAVRENRILITIDKDFGEHVFRDRKQHRGVLLLRLANERVESKIAALQRVLDRFSEQLPLRFVVATEAQVRFADD